jgi:hypothetical protein
MVGVWTGRFADLEIVQRANGSERGNYRESSNPHTFPWPRQNAAGCSGGWNQNANRKVRKADKNPKEERKAKPEMSRD